MEILAKRGFMLMILLGVLVGCGKSGKSEVEVEPDPFHYKFVAEDAALIGLLVTDSAGTEATEISPGIYQFADDYEPVSPIKFMSANRTETGNSFQDLDGDGVRSSADISYDVALEIAYIGTFQALGEREIFANPITALIPATGIPSSGIAGLPEDLVALAFITGIEGAPTNLIEVTDGVEISIQQALSRAAALITALQEGIYIFEGKTENAQDISRAILTGLRASEITSGLLDTSNFVDVAQSAIEASVAQENREKTLQLARSLGEVLMAVSDVQFYEALISMVKKKLTANSSVQNITSLITAAEFTRQDRGIQFAIRLAAEIEATGGMTNFLNSLSVVPINIGNNGQSLVDGGVSDFNLEFQTDTASIKINAMDAFFDQGVLTYYFEDDLYGLKVDADHALLIALNANEVNLLGAHEAGFDSVRLMALCWNDVEQSDDQLDVCGENNANLEFYGLATQDEVCNAQFDAAELAQINALNRQQITCN